MISFTKNRIKKINKLDVDNIPITLLKALEYFWFVDKLIDNEIKKYEGIGDEKLDEILNEEIIDFGEMISLTHINSKYGGFFRKELLRYIGFDENDEVAYDIISDYCYDSVENKDINQLKQELIDWAIDLEKLDS
ncbi:hypothetical protein ACTWQB_01995 [Piscibacillus sp. B03]|uniref:hypothetical protein n=1 Tax=Piscibacillus sp. B03 TaxID=3457430 RepID=UPI003FCC2A37